MKEGGRFLEEYLIVEFGLPANLCTGFAGLWMRGTGGDKAGLERPAKR